MATEPEDPILDAEDEGGPVKGFLEHLEDLRWVLLKSFTALFVSLLVCLFAAPFLVSVLKHPLEQSAKLAAIYGDDTVTIAVRIGTNSVGVFKPGKEYLSQFAPLTVSSNRKVTLDLYPITYGTNNFLGFKVITNENEFPQKAPVELLNLSPAAGFLVALQVAFYGGLLLASPFILYFIAQFVLPALKVNELRYIRKSFIFCIGLFLAGICLCYFGMLPIALRAAVWFSNQMGFGAFQWTADTYIGFVTKFMLAMGIGFELPIFLLLFVKIGLLNYQMLASNRKFVLIIILVVAAFLTPPDIVTQIAMTIPLYGLFEVTALIAWWWERKEKKREEAERAAEEAERQARRAAREKQVAAAAAAAATVSTPSTPTLAVPEDTSTAAAQESSTNPVSEDEGSPKTEPEKTTEETDKDSSEKNEDKEDNEEKVADDSGVAEKEFVPDGEPNPPYMPPGVDEAYRPYAGALEKSSSATSESKDEAEVDTAKNSPSESASDSKDSTKEEKPSAVYQPEENPDIPL